MANVLIATPELSDAATLSGTSAAGANPITNLQKKQPGIIYRPSSLTPYIKADLGANHAVTLIGLICLNASAAATWRVRGAEVEADLTVEPDDFEPFWNDDAVMAADFVNDDYMLDQPAVWDSASSLFRPSGSDDDWPYFLGLKVAEGTALRWWRIEFSDAGNADGALDFGRLYISANASFNIGADYGAGLGFADSTRQNVAISGASYAVRRATRRVWDFSISPETEAEAYGIAFKLDQLRGTSRDVICALDPAAATYLAQKTIYGQFEVLTPVEARSFNNFAKRYRIQELLK